MSKAGQINPMMPVLAMALAVRITVALSFWNVVAFDEVYQFLGQAHRLVFGQGLVPWEYQVGLRCWLVPLVLAAPMALARLVSPSPLFGLAVIRILLCVASLSIVWCAVRWGEQSAGRRGAWIAGLFTALWPDLWLMAPHPLEETLSAYALVPAVYLAGGDAPSVRRVAWAGFLLGLAFTLRMQLAPAIAVAGFMLGGRQFWRWRVALLAAALPVFIAGMLDWYSWGQPFRSFWLNVYLNIFLNVAQHEYGSAPPGYFVFMLMVDWLWALPVFLFLVWRARRLLPLPATAALIIVVVHSLIVHKEYRFIFPALALAVPVAGVGLAVLQRPAWRLASVALAFTAVLASPWPRFMLQLHENGYRVFGAVAARHPRLVSVANWDGSFLPLDILFTAQTRLTDQTVIPTPAGDTAADLLVATPPSARVPPGYTPWFCAAGNRIPWVKPPPPVCVWQRGAGLPPALTGPPFSFPFPQAARPFILRDRMTD